MRSKYDYADPGQDADYCDGLSAEPDGPLCIFCDAPLPYGETDYCDALCAAMAAQDNLEDR